MDEKKAINIQWYPGHMTKAKRMIEANLKLVDIVAELADARVPESSRNPDFDELLGTKPRVLLLNKSDLANPERTAGWVGYYAGKGIKAIPLDAVSGGGMKEFISEMKSALFEKLERDAARGMNKPIKVMLAGIPNVGKSSLINRMAAGKKTKVEDRPGVTRGRQWITTSLGLDLLDTPGLLWPKFDSEKVAQNLAFTGAVRDEVMDSETLGALLAARLRDIAPEEFAARYRLDPEGLVGISGADLLELIAGKRGFLISGGEPDYERAANTLLDEFRGGKIGRITLENPPV